MKTVHLLFDDYPFIESWGYQENRFCENEIVDHDVTVITANYYSKILQQHGISDRLPSFVQYEKYGNILKIYRLKCLFGNTVLGKKIKYYLSLYKVLKEENPNCIFVHDLHALSLLTLDYYLSNNPKVFCIADIHVNYDNSGTTRYSRFFHQKIYGPLIRHHMSNIKRIYYLNDNCKRFLKEQYGIDESIKELLFLPLGGEIIDLHKKKEKHDELCIRERIPSNSVIFIHSGKLNSRKMTIQTMQAFSSFKSVDAYLFIVGTPAKDIKEEFYYELSKNLHIKYLGWKSNNELMELLFAADCYLQPGTPSVTAHEAMCKGCATLLSRKGEHYSTFIADDCVWYINDSAGINAFIEMMINKPLTRKRLQLNAYHLAKKLFDYKLQIKRVFL